MVSLCLPETKIGVSEVLPQNVDRNGINELVNKELRLLIDRDDKQGVAK